ncbi:MAG TPA: DUF3040 domain-containing protein [Mycobacteriales bacterium]|nr:DUF3040 domain-containing protein [Mycobacteriales bacterium]
MPLSEHEQRLLEQIEQALYAEDPKFAQSWRVRDLHSLRRRRVVRAAAVVIAGLGLLIAGVIMQSSAMILGVALGVAGFLFMLGGAWLLVSVRQRPAARPAATSGRRRPKVSIKSRLEERWQRRQDDR